ncbi:MAG: ABC transporter permease [Opitutales bacterium]|nr:ABC transporter permease [Opitutales bacterium]
MRKLAIVKSALKSILRNPMRTFLTTLGIVIGIASVIALMEIGNGAQQSLKKSISTMGVNSITVRPGASMVGGVSSGSGSKATITAEDAEEIVKNCPSVKKATPVVSARGQVVYGGKNWVPFSINGVNEDYLEIGSWSLDDGEMFTRRQVVGGAKVCLIGSTLKRELFGAENPLGKDIRIQNSIFKVIGVLKTKGANMMGMDQDDCVIAPWTAVKARLSGAGQSSISAAGSSAASSPVTTSSFYASAADKYPASSSSLPPVRFRNVDSVSAWANSPESVAAAVSEITEVLRRTHGLADGAEDDFQIRTMSEFSDFLTGQTKTMTNLLLCVAFVSLIVGGVGIMNIMLVSVTERTREIGLRMAVGAKRRDILRQFLVEAVVICMLGGIVGIGVGHLSSRVLAGIMNWPSSISY